MLRKTIALLAFAGIILLLPLQSKAQEAENTTQLNAGVGFGDWGIPVYVGLDQYVHPDITIGGVFSYRSYDEKWRDERFDHDVIGLSANGNYHFNSLLEIPEQWDFYAGLNIGFYIWDSPGDYPGNHTSGLGLGAQLGGRYFFNDKVGLNIEFGGGDVVSGGKFGLTIRL